MLDTKIDYQLVVYRLQRLGVVLLYVAGAGVATGALAALLKVSTSWFMALVACLLLGYVGLVFWRARYAVDGSPRQDMFICNVHGPMPKSAVFQLFDFPLDQEVNGRTKRAPVMQCPLCYQKAINVARANLEKK